MNTFQLPRLLRAILFFGVLWPTLVQAGKTIDERHDLAADGTVSINNLAGVIEVVAGTGNEVVLSGELGEDVVALEVEGDRKTLRIFVRYPEKRSGALDETLLRVRVPVAATLEIESVSADVRVRDTAGALQVETVSGEVSAQVRAPRVRLHSVSGDIDLVAPAQDTRLQSVSGDVRANGIGGELRAESVSGDVVIEGGDALSELALQTVSGDIRVRGLLAAGAEVEGESLSGDVTLRLAQPPDAEVALQSFSGSVRSQFGNAKADRERKLRQTLGSGKGRIELTSFSGDALIEHD